MLLIHPAQVRVAAKDEIHLPGLSAFFADCGNDPIAQAVLVEQPECNVFFEKPDGRRHEAKIVFVRRSSKTVIGFAMSGRSTGFLFFSYLPPMCIRLIVLLLLFTHAVSAQDDYTWWNEKHDWDGFTPWNQYLTVSPKYFGPNALPVPQVRTGLLDSTLQFEAAAGGHFSKGDDTWDSFLRLYLPIANGKVALEARVVPLEYYAMDTVTRDLRAARDYDGKGHAGGDIYFSTLVQLLRNRRGLPDVSFEFAIRTASGTQLGAARFTDAPGYYLALGFGKKYVLNNERSVSIRPFATGGFYVYQTFDVEHLQNDCIYYGAGVSFMARTLEWSNQLAGYAGYIGNGDHPMVWRSVLTLHSAHIDWNLRYQQGLHDFEYNSVHFGAVLKFSLK